MLVRFFLLKKNYKENSGLCQKRVLNLETRGGRAVVYCSYLCYLLRFWLKEAFFLGWCYSLRCLIMELRPKHMIKVKHRLQRPGYRYN